MSDYIEFTAKHTEEALAKASQHFGLPLNRLEWEVVEAGSSGLFGLIGAKKAKVKVRPAAGSMAEEMAALAAVVSDQVRPRAKEPQEIPAPAPQPEPAPEEPPARRAPEAKAAPAAVKPSPQPSPPPAPTPAPPKPEPSPAPPAEEIKAVAPPEAEEEEELAVTEEASAESFEEEEPEAALIDEEEEDEGEGRLEQDPAVIERAREVLARLIEPLDAQGRVEVKGGSSGIKLEIVSREAGVLIGRRGQHLEALQYLVTRIVSHQEGKPVRISVDAGGYRQRRREALEEMALKVAEKAKATGKGVSIGPLSAPERRVIHMTLKNQPGITTSSRGRGELKKVVVSAR